MGVGQSYILLLIIRFDSIQTKTLFDGIVVSYYLISYQGNIAQKILHFIAQPLLSRTKFYLKANISRDKFYT